MIEKNLEPIKEIDTQDVFKHIFDNGQQNILALDAAPTATVPLIEPNQVGKYENDVYWRIGDTILKISSDSQITVTV